MFGLTEIFDTQPLFGRRIRVPPCHTAESAVRIHDSPTCPASHTSLVPAVRRLKQIKPEYFEESGVLRILADKVRLLVFC